MFSKSQLTIGDWWLFWILMIIPFVNIYVFFVVLLSSNVNKTMQNQLRAAILPFVIIFVLAFSTGFFATIMRAV